MAALRFLTVFFVLLLLAIPTAVAQGGNAPYSPERFSVDELIVTERFQSVPLTFPWNRIASERVAARGRRDFAVVYDVNYDEARQFLRQAYRESRDFINIEPAVFPYSDIAKLRVAGLEMGDNSGRISVGHPDMEPLFTVDIEADGQRTVFIIRNLARTRQFSGFMPSRVNFLPIGADAVNFRFN